MGKWQDVYGRKLWKIRRKQALRRDKYKCQWCLEKGIIRGAKEVHHIVHLNKKNYKDSRIAYGLENLVSLCENCTTTRQQQVRLRMCRSRLKVVIQVEYNRELA